MNKVLKLFCANIIATVFFFTFSNVSFSQSIAAGGGQSLFLCSDGIPKACGFNNIGQLGDGTNTTRTTPVQVALLSNITDVACGSGQSIFLKNDGTVWACGYNNAGQLGDGTTVDKNSPVQIASLSGIIAIAGGSYHSLFLKSDGTVWACGDNGNGGLGDGTSISKSTPVQVSSLSGIVAMAGGSNFSLFVKNDGTVWSCGYNSFGQLGKGTTGGTNLTPAQVSITNVIAVAAGNAHSLFLKSDSTVWACGDNGVGQLGDGTAATQTTPVQVSGLTGITAIETGQSHSLFLKNTGTVWACGYNGYGQLGDGTITDRYTPVQVSGLTGITAITGGSSHSLFLKNNGSVRACGYNAEGELGNGTTSNSSSTVQTSCPCVPVVSIGGNMTTCSGGTVTLTASGANTYQWNTGATTTSISVSPTVNTTYTVTGSLSAGCNSSAVVTVTVTAAGFTNSSSTICPGGSINFTDLSTGSPTAWSWSFPGGTPASSTVQNPSVSYSASGNYSVTVIVTSTCGNNTKDTSLNVVVSSPTVTVGGSATICSGDPTTLTASGASTYQWNTSATTASIVVSPTASTTYSVTGTDAGGCSSSATGTLTVNALPSVSTSGNTTICSGSSATFTAAGATAYQWSTGANTAGITVNPTANTTYTVTGTDATGCSNTSTVMATVNALPVVSISGNLTICTGSGTTLTASGATAYLWSHGPTTPVTSVSPTISTSYTLTGTDANGCSNTSSASVMVNALPAITINGNTNVCSGSPTSLTAAGANTYLWSTGAATPVTTVSPPVTSTYTVTGTDANGCSNTQTATVTAVALPVITIGGNTTICSGSSTTLTASGASTYQWSTSAITASIAITPASTTSYSITGTNASGCANSSTVTVMVNALPSLVVPHTNVSCFGGSNGGATANPGGGLSPYAYNWSTGAITQNISGLIPGNYNVTITDANSCTKSATVSVTQPTALTLTLSSSASNCFGANAGSATVSPSGGIPPYAYTWNNGQTTQTASSLAYGNYSVKVTDANGCTMNDTITVSQPLPIPVSVTVTPASCGNSGGSASVSVSGAGAVPPFAYLWSTGSTDAIVNGLSAGLYRVNVTDGNGCFSFADALVENSNGPTLAINTVTDVSCNGLSDGRISINISGGTLPYTYKWSDGQTTQNISNLAYGPYDLLASDASGCVAQKTAFVNQPLPLVVISSVINSSCKAANGQAAVTVSGGNIPYTYLWASGGTSSSIIAGAGVYTITVTDSKGCQDQAFVAVQDSGGPVVMVDTIAAANCGSGGYVLLMPQDTQVISAFNWTNGAITQNLANSGPGNYGVVITDTSGCKSALLVPINPVLPDLKPICLVTVDSTSTKNIVVWDKPLSAVASGFNIYRESSSNGIFQKVGFVPYASPSRFDDQIVDPDGRWAKYRISMKDVCGNDGPLSPEHKTVHLSKQSATSTKIRIIWDAYEGLPFSFYRIYRKTNSSGSWVLIDSVPSNVTIYSDLTFSKGDTSYYHIDVAAAGGCSVSGINPEPDAVNLNSSKSNIYRVIDSTLTNVLVPREENTISIFPNPGTGIFTLEIGSRWSGGEAGIFNVLGEEVKRVTLPMSSNRIQVDLGGNAAGVYYLHLKSGNTPVNKKIIIR